MVAEWGQVMGPSLQLTGRAKGSVGEVPGVEADWNIGIAGDSIGAFDVGDWWHGHSGQQEQYPCSSARSL